MGEDGQPCYDDFAGSGGGVVNQDFVRLIKAGDRGTDDPNSPRNLINGFYYKPPFRAEREEDFLTASLADKIGDDRYPGDFIPSPNWPNVAPGQFCPVNSWSPKYIGENAGELISTNNKPSLPWVRGDADLIVSDNSMFDLATLGSMGYVPGWPGMDVYPPQPMLAQTRAVLHPYAQAGGAYTEHVIAVAAHGVFIEKPKVFKALFHAFLSQQL